MGINQKKSFVKFVVSCPFILNNFSCWRHIKPIITPLVEPKIQKYSVHLMDKHSVKKVLRMNRLMLKFHNFGPKQVQMADLTQLEDFF